MVEWPKMKSDVVPVRIEGGGLPRVSALVSTQTFAKCAGIRNLHMIGLTRGSKQSRYSDVIGVLCFGCDKMTSQSSPYL